MYGFLGALGARELDRSPGGPGAFLSLSSPGVSSYYCPRLASGLLPGEGSGVLSPSGTAPPPGAGRGRGWRSAPPSAPPARPARFVALLVRLRQPWTRSSHDGGCSRRRRTRGARWGRRARGRRGLGANVSLCVYPFPSSPSVCWARRPRRKAWMTAPTSSRRKTAE